MRFRVLPALLVVCAIASPLAAAPQTPADLTVTLTDHNFQLSTPVVAGPLAWHVRNEGSEPHQALVIRLPEGVTESQERAWLASGSEADEPGERIAGATAVEPGAEATFQTNLQPGTYLLVCNANEAQGRHFELGMLYRFTVE
jgi:hypothetical protein